MGSAMGPKRQWTKHGCKKKKQIRIYITFVSHRPRFDGRLLFKCVCVCVCPYFFFPFVSPPIFSRPKMVSSPGQLPNRRRVYFLHARHMIARVRTGCGDELARAPRRETTTMMIIIIMIMIIRCRREFCYRFRTTKIQFLEPDPFPKNTKRNIGDVCLKTENYYSWSSRACGRSFSDGL